MSNDSIFKTFLVAFLLCVVCSILVCLAAIVRIDKEAYNKQLEIRKTVLAAGGFQQQIDDGGNIDELFTANMELRLVDLETGEYTTAVDAATYDQKEAVNNPELSVKIPADQDLAGIGTRAKYAAVYLEKSGDIVLPIRGAGMWGPMYGYIAIAADGTTVKGFTFYQHAETPGLGAEVDNPKWKQQWPDKKLYNDSGKLVLKVVKKGEYNPNAADAVNTIDGIAGSTVTGGKVHNIIRYWFGENGYAPFLNKLKAKRG
ncbi:Na(+)-translocating NADH-quinone reductase subunit C [uncultured Desulfuromusa sp.]|uniref:Na(+)-translocating NADH-quinone reductase subunit C n=1 Tax=uncultured Desulfuromusa sp. TaxID=219183 RepID=UPI002AA6B035|nr:Na(+)-translocating NADH-quinone reductase subunit C [uncultured Desulfuromusa sp.]